MTCPFLNALAILVGSEVYISSISQYLQWSKPEPNVWYLPESFVLVSHGEKRIQDHHIMLPVSRIENQRQRQTEKARCFNTSDIADFCY